MDTDISRWIVEFILRQPMFDEVISKALTFLPFPNDDSRLKKTLLLRSIQVRTKPGSAISDEVLENLELVEELDRIDGVAITDSMKAAYCAVAVCCTLDHVGDGGDEKGDFFGAVRRIWRRKVDKMEGQSGLFSDELARWRDEIEATVVDEDARRSLLKKKRNAEERALLSVKSYLEEAWEIMGPSFLESTAKVATGMQGSSTGSDQADLPVTGSEDVLTRNLGDNGGSRNESGPQMFYGGVVQGPNKVGESALGSADPGKGLGGDGSEKVEVAHQEEARHGFGDEQVADNAVGGVASLSMGSRNESGAQMVNEGVVQKPSKVGESALGSDDPGKGLEGYGCEKVEVAHQEEARNGLGDGHVADNVGETVEKMVIRKSHRKKRVARRKCIVRRAVIVDAEDSGSDMSCTENDHYPSPDVRQVHEALKSSNIELKAMVNDPLPDALKMSETVRCELQKNDEPVQNQNQNGEDVVEEPIPDTERNHEPARANEANVANQEKYVRPCLMERNSTACTYEWDDSTEETTNGRKRMRLPTPDKIVCSPLKNAAAAMCASRKRKKRWSVLEEETLRTGVHLYGKGNWKVILTSYPDIFGERSTVDLKDKWRNLTKV